MGDQLQQLPVAVLRFQVPAAVDENGAVVVLKTAVTLIQQMQDEEIVRTGGNALPHQSATGPTDLFDVVEKLRVPAGEPRFGGGVGKPGDPTMGHAVNREVVLLMGTRFERTVDEVIQVRRQPCPRGFLR